MEIYHWRFSFKKLITIAHSKSFNSSGFNPILREFYEMICKIIVSKTLCGIFFIFCRSSFINNFMVKNNFLEPKNHQNLNISRPIYFKKISAHRFVGLICTNKLEAVFFLKMWSFFRNCKTTNLCFIFFHKKWFYTVLYFKGDYLILI